VQGGTPAEGRVIVVAHREPFRVVQRNGVARVERPVGGLVAALQPVMRDTRGVWISADVDGEADRAQLERALAELPYEWQPVRCVERVACGFYRGFSNGALWPLYHSMPGRTVYHSSDWAAYREVNEQFADASAAICKRDDIAWIHDYQLSLVPQLLRARLAGRDVRIGFLLHVPFPHCSLFRTLPWAREILLGMLGAGLIVFHVQEYCEHFFECVERLLNLRCDRLRGTVALADRLVHVRAIPIGIDADAIRRCADQPEVVARAALLKAEVGAESLVIGVDRLDYTKGILERLRALELFFQTHHDRHRRVSMVQLAVPSRESIEQYAELREQIERQVGYLNGLYAQPGWTPVTYLYRSLPFEELVALYRAADVAMVTPLRDGMNLVAKEFVAAHANQGGVLVLSELAGAAQQLTEAVLVNPYDVTAMSETLTRALEMPAEEQERRMRRLNAKISRFDIHHWCDTFLAECRFVE